MKTSVLVVDNIVTADDAVKALRNELALVCGHSYRGGVYTVWVQHLYYGEELFKRAMDALATFPSAGQAACLSCENRHVCEIDPNLCGRWLD